MCAIISRISIKRGKSGLAEIAPFRGIRYNQSVVGNLSKVTCPPYDVISPEDRVYYHQLHPCNFVRLVLGEEFENDNEHNNRFTRARDYLALWLEQGILKQDPEPAIYVYQQQYEIEGKLRSTRGIVCAVKLHDYSDKVILPHENTLAKPKSQLIQLIRETKANLDSIYALYADQAGVLEKTMDQVMSQAPNAEAKDKDNVKHALWIMSEPDGIQRCVDFLADKQIAIADGHHRYETSLAYCDEVRSKLGYNGDECRELASDYTLMTLVNVYQPDMTIFPTHRVVGNLPDEAVVNLENRLSELFEIGISSPDRLLADMARLSAIGMYCKGRARTLKPKPEVRSLLQGSKASRDLELNVLHDIVLERMLGIDEDKLRNQTHIVYTRDPKEAIELVDSGKRQLAFLLNNIDVKSVLEIASAGERMPQKATYFYPKLLSGLVLRKLA
jgi:uncharacterized protein (DUF1015 family)